MNHLLAQLRRNQRRGSKPRCHLLTHGEAVHRSAALNELVVPWAEVIPDDVCMPTGFDYVGEAQLHSASRLLEPEIRAALTAWWLSVPSANATTPSWDIASTCRIGGKRGLLLIEAKAHHGELIKEEAGKILAAGASANSRRNHIRIGASIEEANIALSDETGCFWELSRGHHYQMSNRFAWSWKLSELGVPVVLVYLGFLDCQDMAADSKIIANDADWQRLVRAHSATIAPPDVWNRSWQLHGQTFVPLIRTSSIPLPTL